MKVLTLQSGNTEHEVLQIETPLNGFLIVSNYSEIIGMQIEVVHVTRDGSQTRIPKQHVLQAAAEGVAQGFEIIKMEHDSERTGVVIPITSGGALELNGGYLTLRVYKESLSTGQVYALESIGRTGESLSYEKIHTNAGVPKDINVSEASGLIVDIGYVSEVELRYLNGDRITLANEEIQYLSGAVPEKQVTNMDGVGLPRFFCLSVENVLTAKVTTTQNNNVVLVK